VAGGIRADEVLQADLGDEEVVTIRFRRRLDVVSTGKVWAPALAALRRAGPRRVVVEAGEVEYCDGAGVALLFEMKRRQAARDAEFEIRGLSSRFQDLLDKYSPKDFQPPERPAPERLRLVRETGRGAMRILRDLRGMVYFVGELTAALADAIARPHTVRWGEVMAMAEKVGANAFPLLALEGLLTGFVITYEAAVSLRQYGAESLAGQFIATALIKQVAPVLVGVLLIGRSASAFAAELGTMEATEEISAMRTMGLEPVRFLVVVRVLAVAAMLPLMAAFFAAFGMVGGALVSLVLGTSLAEFWHEASVASSAVSVAASMFKCVLLGLIAGAIGCMRGLQAKRGASAVGDAATSAVVTGIVVLSLVDAAMAYIYDSVGI
jgi:phospholipid/cholesterol/gamma-HCH transport system permease protein